MVADAGRLAADPGLGRKCSARFARAHPPFPGERLPVRFQFRARLDVSAARSVLEEAQVISFYGNPGVAVMGVLGRGGARETPIGSRFGRRDTTR